MKRNILIGVTTLLMLAALYMVFIYVPTDAETGIIQRIFYFHVPLAWVAFFAFLFVFAAGINYLWKRDRKWDFIASTSAEIGLVFTTLMLITGSIWAKPAWGAWWVWDTRLTSSLVLWFIYLAYFIVRSYISEEERRARFAAVVGIIGFIDVPVIILAVMLWRTQHPGPIVFEGGLAPEMMATLMVAIAAFTSLYFLLFTEGVYIKKDEDEVNKLKASFGGSNG